MLRYFATGPDLPVRTDDSVDGAFKSYRMRIILTITLAYAISYTCRLAINIVKKPLIDQGIFTPLELGMIARLQAGIVGRLVLEARIGKADAGGRLDADGTAAEQ